MSAPESPALHTPPATASNFVTTVLLQHLFLSWQDSGQVASLRTEPMRGPGTRSHWQCYEELTKKATDVIYMWMSYWFAPKLDAHVVASAMALIPDDVRSREGDTKESLVVRIAGAGFYDPLQALVGGGRCGSKRVCANSTDYSQPRRKSWSVVVHDVHLNERGEQVRTMYAYGKRNSRIRTEVHAEPMPKEIAALGMQCFFAVRHVLCDVCASSPPNHCQLLGYYGLFDSKVGIHKDDHELNTLYLMQLGQMDVADAVNTTKGAMVPGRHEIRGCCGRRVQSR